MATHAKIYPKKTGNSYAIYFDNTCIAYGLDYKQADISYRVAMSAAQCCGIKSGLNEEILKFSEELVDKG